MDQMDKKVSGAALSAATPSVLHVMSYYEAPITNKRPARTVSVPMLYQLLTSDESLRHATQRVRALADAGDSSLYRRAKQQLPYVTPAGVFTYCAARNLVYPNGLQVLDIDHLSSLDEAQQLRDRLFDDPGLNAQLAFVSPSGRGVKVIVPYDFVPSMTLAENHKCALEQLWFYLEQAYHIAPDTSGSDIARACFLAHDEGAHMRCG